MILAAGLGTRLRPLSLLRAKPAMPVVGRPVIGYLLALLERHGVRDVIVNLHHLPGSITAAVERFAPEGLRIHYSHESRPLGTGGGIRLARDFLAGDEPVIVLAGDMLLDADLSGLVEAHRASGAHCTLVLRRDPRASEFGTIGLDAAGRVRRIAGRFDLGGETRAGVFLGVRILSSPIFDHLPDVTDDTPFEDLSDWLAPALAAGHDRIRGHLLAPEEAIWEPVGTPAEYLAANLAPPALSYLDPARNPAEGTKALGPSADVILGAGARIGAGASLERCVVWEDERVPDGFRARGGVFAGGRFYACEESGEPGRRADDEGAVGR
jgi:mannose-1-phosphate guanylyltransferase